MRIRKLIPPGTQFARWTVLGPGPDGTNHLGRPIPTSHVRCIDGNEAVVPNGQLRSGHSRSCGCLRHDLAIILNTTHGHAGANRHSRIYSVWAGMIQRTTDRAYNQFQDYGGRGVSVCERWRTFDNFLEDMGPGKIGWTIERINNDGNYELANCLWATRAHQGRNKRTNRILTVRGITACLVDLCERFGVPYSRIKYRLDKDWSPERAFFTPCLR